MQDCISIVLYQLLNTSISQVSIMYFEVLIFGPNRD